MDSKATGLFMVDGNFGLGVSILLEEVVTICTKEIVNASTLMYDIIVFGSNVIPLVEDSISNRFFSDISCWSCYGGFLSYFFQALVSQVVFEKM